MGYPLNKSFEINTSPVRSLNDISMYNPEIGFLDFFLSGQTLDANE
jgi:hypothetical protein